MSANDRRMREPITNQELLDWNWVQVEGSPDLWVCPLCANRYKTSGRARHWIRCSEKGLREEHAKVYTSCGVLLEYRLQSICSVPALYPGLLQLVGPFLPAVPSVGNLALVYVICSHNSDTLILYLIKLLSLVVCSIGWTCHGVCC
jgi:hypothetical protein